MAILRYRGIHGGWLIVALLIARPAHGQIDLDPILQFLSLDQFAEMRSAADLSTAQANAALTIYQLNLQAYDDALAIMNQGPSGSPITNPTEAIRRNRARTARIRQRIALIQTHEDAFFDAIGEFIADSQEEGLNRYRSIRRRTLQNYFAFAFGRRTQRQFIMLDERAIAACAREFPAPADTLLAYAAEVAPLLSRLDDEETKVYPAAYRRIRDEHGVRDFDDFPSELFNRLLSEEATESLDLARQLDLANIEWLSTIANALDPRCIPTFIRDVGMEGFWDSNPVWNWSSAVEAFCDHPEVSDDVRSEVVKHILTELPEVQDLMRSVVKRRNRTFVFGLSDENMREVMLDTNAAVQQRYQSTIDLLSAIDDRIDEPRYEEIFGVCIRQTHGISRSDHHTSSDWSWSLEFASPTTDELATVLDRLNLSPEARNAADALLADYRAQVRPLPQKHEFREGEWIPQKLRADLRDTIEELVENLKVLADDERDLTILELLALDVERRLHADRVLFARGITGVDPARFVLLSEDVSREMILAIADRMKVYHDTVIPALTARLALEEKLRGDDKRERTRADRDTIEESTVQLAEASMEFIEDAQRLTGLESLREQYLQTALPFLFNRINQTYRRFADALENDDIDPAVREQITNAWLDFTDAERPLREKVIAGAIVATFWSLPRNGRPTAGGRGPARHSFEENWKAWDEVRQAADARLKILLEE